MRRATSILGLIVGLYLIGRAIVELFLVDTSDPASYRNDWGGPSLFGVLAVHCGPGLLAAVAILIALFRRHRGHRTGRMPTP